MTFLRRLHKTRPQTILLLFLWFAFAIRVYHLAAQSLWYDEGVSWYLTRMSLPRLTHWTANDIQPPLYYYLLWIWVRLAGESEYALRFISVAFGVLSIPLMWAFARRWLSNTAGWLVVLLAFVSPLHVYYSQETRMYTMMTFLGLLSSYLLLRFLEEHRLFTRRVWTGAYVLTIVALLYTHYFGFFLIVAHAIYISYVWWRERREHISHLLAPGTFRLIGAAAAAIFVFYLPWLPFLLTRYGTDTSYWYGTLNLGEIALKLFVSFALGETVKENVGLKLGIGYGLIFLITLLALLILPPRSGRKRSDFPYPVTFLVLYLSVPVLMVLILAFKTPKFNPRYAMFAWPAFVLVVAGGLSALSTWWYDSFTSERWIAPAGRLIAALALGFVLLCSLYSLGNWFAPYRLNQFNKADFRITSEIVTQRIGPKETVLLSSGHMFPAWAYYYGWQGWHALPDIEVLDVNAVLDMTVGPQLETLLEDVEGVWLVRWQNEVTDPFDVLPLFLETTGQQDDYGQFWHMDLHHYTLPPDAHFSVESFLTYPTQAEFGGQISLLGMRHTQEPDFVLVWEAIGPIDGDYTVFVHLLDGEGNTLISADHLPPRPTHEWRSGSIVPDRVSIEIPPGMAGDGYRLAIGLYDAGLPGLSRLDAQGSNVDQGQVIFPVDLKDW